MGEIAVKDLRNEEEEGNVVPLRVVTGGKGTDENWLSKLPVGTVFVTRPKKMQVPFLQILEVVYHGEKYSILLDNLNDGKYAPVDTRMFSLTYDLFEIKYEPKEEEQDG